jgi:hypothetical protein
MFRRRMIVGVMGVAALPLAVLAQAKTTRIVMPSEPER